MIVLLTGVLLVLVGLWGILTRKDIIRIIIGFAVADTGINLILVAIGNIRGRTAPIIDSAVSQAQGKAAGIQALNRVVDPIPSALVLTAIVIGLAVTALMLSYAIRMHREKQSLNIDDFEELKW